MSFACGKKKVKQKLAKNELDLLKEKFRFNENELLEFKRRFNNLTKSSKFLDKETFRENMGLLGLDSGSFLADRIFAALDVDKDHYIMLEEYLRYFDILIYGSPEEKHNLTFRMIDVDAKGFFTYDEFKDMILSMLYTWNNLTGSHYNITQNQKLDNFLTSIFQRFDIEDQGRVTSQNFATVVARDPQLLDIFNHFNQGIIESVQPNTELDQKDQNVINDLEQLYEKLNQLRIFVTGKAEALELPQDEPGENKADYLKPDVSPRAELKTPIVSNLDSLIRRTIFFEPFKEGPNADKDGSLKPFRQQSDIGTRVIAQRRMERDNSEYQRRWSHQPNGQQAFRAFKKEEEVKEYDGNTMVERGKSVDVIYQEGTSTQSLPQPRDPAHFSTFRKEKIEEEDQKAVDQSQGTARFESVPLMMSQFQTVQTRRGAGLANNMNTNDSVHREQTEVVVPVKNQDSFQALQTPKGKQGEEQDFSHPSQLTPNTKKLMLKLRSLPLEAKVLDEECDVPDLAQNMFDLHQQVELAESVLLQSKQPGNNLYNPFKPGSPSAAMRLTGQWPAQQVSEQLETLAAETLKIIEEIRSKKKKVEPRLSDVEEAQKKATSLNIHKMPVKDRKGNYVLFGHQNWNLVLNMMLGIQMAVKSVVEKEGELSNKDFNVKYIFELVPKRTSETKVSYKICTFFDYAPAIFYELRRLYGIKNEDYLRSIGPETMLGNLIKGNLTSLSELTSTGKSGSFFYYSSDGKYTLKTISKDEFHFLRQILKNYYTHIINSPQSLIIKFFGLHKIRFMKKNGSREKVYFIIMANVFHTFKEIHVRYDLKGSTKGRYTKENDPSVAKKDLNIILSKEKILLPPDMANSFVDIVERDSRFFEENGIIDYSLLMGVHFLSQKEINAREGMQRRQFYESAIHGREGIPSLDNTKLYFFGIIDILTHFNAKKKAEYVVKRLAYGKGISAVPPRTYAERFRKFIKSLVKTQV